MEVDFAFLADAAEAVNGKIYVIGGAFDTIWANSAPLNHPHLSFIAKLLLSPAELGRHHQIELKIVNEDGKTAAPPITAQLNVAKNENLQRGWKQGHIFVLNFGNLRFENFGDYSFEIVVNNSSLKNVALHIAKRP